MNDVFMQYEFCLNFGLIVKETNKQKKHDQNLMKRDKWVRSVFVAGAFLMISFVWNFQTCSYYSYHFSLIGHFRIFFIHGEKTVLQLFSEDQQASCCQAT